MTDFERTMLALQAAQFELLALIARRHITSEADLESIKSVRAEVEKAYDRIMQPV